MIEFFQIVQKTLSSRYAWVYHMKVMVNIAIMVTNFFIQGLFFKICYHFFCIYCQYTLRNRNRFIFDDIYAGQYREDTIPPQVLKVSVEQQFPSRLLVTFSETVYMETALKNENYVLQNSMYSPVHCEFVDETHQIVRLYFADAFLERERFFLQIQNVTDIQGVPMLPVTRSFVWWNPHRNDVLITE